MYNPEIRVLYKLKGEQSYYLITAFENPNMSGVKINFQMPGTNHVFEYKGLQQVNDFLHSIEPVRSVPSELEGLAGQERDLKSQIALLRSQREFLQQHSKSQKRLKPAAELLQNYSIHTIPNHNPKL